MPSDRVVRARIADRIARSGVTLTVHFPAPKPAAPAPPTGGTVATPLTGRPPVAAVAPPPPAPPPPEPVVLRCLWLDADTLAATRGAPDVGPGGWVAGATAMARVRAADAEAAPAGLHPAAPGGPRWTLFEEAAAVECRGSRYRVLKVTPLGPSFGPPHSYAVWLAGATKQ